MANKPTKFQELIAKVNDPAKKDPNFYNWTAERVSRGTYIPINRARHIFSEQSLPTFAEALAILNLIIGCRKRPEVREIWPALADDPISSAGKNSRLDNGIANDHQYGEQEIEPIWAMRQRIQASKAQKRRAHSVSNAN